VIDIDFLMLNKTENDADCRDILIDKKDDSNRQEARKRTENNTYPL